MPKQITKPKEFSFESALVTEQYTLGLTIFPLLHYNESPWYIPIFLKSVTKLLNYDVDVLHSYISASIKSFVACDHLGTFKWKFVLQGDF